MARTEERRAELRELLEVFEKKLKLFNDILGDGEIEQFRDRL